MQILFEQSDSNGSFFIDDHGELLAIMTFSKAGERIIIDHTEVSGALRGKNIGKQLVAAAVEHARKSNLKILPLCPYAKSVFEKVRQYQDVLDQ